MGEQYITSLHVSKLGHNLPEVRERALKNLISKLNVGIPFDNVFARSKEILIKSFEWFTFDDRISDDLILELIRNTLLENENGSVLISYFGVKTIISKLETLCSQVYGTNITKVNEIIDFLKNKQQIVIPPLVSDVPLSYRSEGEHYNYPVESTATPIDLYVVNTPDKEQQTGFFPNSTKRSKLSDSTSVSEPTSRNSDKNTLPHYTFCWQPLVTTDKHVLDSIESSIRKPERSSLLLQTCSFLMDVLLRDFPPEVLLQRPNILKELEKHFFDCSSYTVKVTIGKCFLKFSQSLMQRIKYCSDPGIHNLKQHKQVFLQKYESNVPHISNCRKEDHNVAVSLKCAEIPTPAYSLSTLKWILDQFLHVNQLESRELEIHELHLYLVLLRVIDNLICISCMSLNQQIWNNRGSNVYDELTKLIYGVFEKFSEAIQNLFLNILGDDFASIFHISYITLIINFVHVLKHLIPPDLAHLILPPCVKKTLAIISSDATIMFFYSKLYEDVLEYIKGTEYKLECLSKYSEIQSINNSMKTAVKLLKSPNLNSRDVQMIEIKESLRSLDYHKNLKIIDIFLELCCSGDYEEDVDDITDILLYLLSNRDIEIKMKIYNSLKDKIIVTMGPSRYAWTHPWKTSNSINMNFILNRLVFSEIILNGLSSDTNHIFQSAEDIILLILKSMNIVSENTWGKIIELILLTYPALVCFGNTSSPLGQTIVNIIDPDKAKIIGFPSASVFKCNLMLLFSRYTDVRAEALSRLCWLLSLHSDHRNLLPRLNNICNKSFNNICIVKYPIDLNRCRESQNYYQSTNIVKVLELLDSRNVEPIIRRSALTQLAVMTEDHLLHNAFMESHGVKRVADVLRKALTDDCYEDYPDSAIPAIAILKNLSLYSSSVRQNLATDNELLHFILRAMLLYCTDDRLINDSNILLFFLLFNDYLNGYPAQGNLSLRSEIIKNIQTPFKCKTTELNSRIKNGVSLDDNQYTFFLKLMWNNSWYGETEIMSWNVPKYDEHFSKSLYLNKYDLIRIQNASLEYSVKKGFDMVQRSGDDAHIENEIMKLIGYTNLYQLLGRDNTLEFDILSLPWKPTLERFLSIEPSKEPDILIVLSIIECLKLVIPLYKTRGKKCWISDTICHFNNPLLSVLKQNVNQNENMKELKQELFRLIMICAHSEQHYAEFYETDSDNQSSFLIVYDIISESLKQDAQGFYNLALLDGMLSCLVNITGNLGWSRSDSTFNKHSLLQTTCSLCELIGTFHCGKGSSASESVMGLNISKNALLALNHLLAEMLFTNVDSWDTGFTEDGSGIENNLFNLFQMRTSRDVIVRATTFQLFSGLFLSSDCVKELIENLKKRNDYCLGELLFSVVIDEDEASLVKEHATNTLSNYINTSHKSAKNYLNNIPNFLNDNFFGKVIKATTNFYDVQIYHIDNEQYFNYFYRLYTDSSEFNNCLLNPTKIIVSPGYIKSLASLVLRLHQVFAANIDDKFMEHQIVRRFIKLLTPPNLELYTTYDVTLYCNVMEMNIAILDFTIEVLNESSYLKSIGNSDDCVTNILCLLNTNIYCCKLTQLLYLRNKLWSKAFRLLGTFFYLKHQEEECSDVLQNLFLGKIDRYYFDTLCESINSNQFQDLQESALKSLTSILTFHTESSSPSSTSSVRSLLDDTTTPRLEINAYRLEEMETVHYNTEVSLTSAKNSIKSSEVPKAGSELCRLLFHLWQLASLNATKKYEKRKELIINTLSGVVLVSLEAKQLALESGGALFVVKQLREVFLKLSLQPLEALRNVVGKKKITPLLVELGLLIQFLNNFSTGCETAKVQISQLDFPDLIHKLWNWICAIPDLLLDVLKTLCTFTSGCLTACDSLCTTNPTAGSRPKKSSSNNSLIHAIIEIILKETDLISKMHNMSVLKLSFHLLQNCCLSTECRSTILKTNLFGGVTKLHPYITKRQKPWDHVQILWLEFIKNMTAYPEGQVIISKYPDLLQMLISFCNNGMKEAKLVVMMILRNMSYSTTNRPRLLACSGFLQVLDEKLSSGNLEEKLIIVSIMWFLAANNQKAKLILKCAGLDSKLRNAIQEIRLSTDYENIDPDVIQKMRYVLQLLRDSDN